jgi:hypothetical protein
VWSISVLARLCFLIIKDCLYLDPQYFCCTTQRDVIFMERCSASVMSMICIIQHGVVCWVTAITTSLAKQRCHSPTSQPHRSEDAHHQLHRCSRSQKAGDHPWPRFAAPAYGSHGGRNLMSPTTVPKRL